MTRISTVRRALLAGAMSATLLVAAGCGMTGMNHEATSPTGTTGTTQPGAGAATFNDADVMFAQMMIPHHQQAVEMASLAETRAQNSELKRLAATIRAAQQPEITTMTGWLTGWGRPIAAPSDMGGMSHGGHGGMSGMMSADEMAQLSAASGVDFDRMFARMMIAHHNGAIQMAQELETTGTSPTAIALAKSILKSQAAEVATLQTISDRL